MFIESKQVWRKVIYLLDIVFIVILYLKRMNILEVKCNWSKCSPFPCGN